MRWHFRVPMFVIAGALLGLIVLLATFQYRWLGQISGAERERMTANLNTRATAFGQDFDRELTRAYLLFQLDPMQQDQSAATGLVARYDRWQATARFPRMIKDVYIVPSADAADAPALLRRFNPSTRFIEPADWPASLSEIRAQLRRPPAAGGSTSAGVAFLMRTMVPTVWSAVPALVVSTPTMMLTHLGGGVDAGVPAVHMPPDMRYTVVLLDADYIRTEMLPALAQQHFQGTGDGFDYQLAVVSTAARGLVYHSVPEFVPAADAGVDARVELFQVRLKDFEPLVNEVSRFATFSAVSNMGGQGDRTVIRETIAGPSANVAIRTVPMSIVVQRGSSAAVQPRVDALIAGATAAAVAHAGASPAQWRLLVKHPSGSLEHAVNAVRRRNLLVSTSILGILGLSVGFLVVSTRRAQDLARQQLEFVATVSHELRTPLAVIRSAADNLADGIVNDEARIRQYGELVRREGLRLTDLVEQILEFAGLQSGQRTMTARPVSVSALVRDVAAAAEPVARPAGIAIELEIADNLPLVTGDEAALRRVFQNLIGNAIKYGADARWIGVRAISSGGRLRVSVTDRGIGIPPAEQTKIFDPFYRAPDVVAAQIQGAGLGLSLVKRIVEAHAGEVTLESAPGEGSTFTVSLPVLEGDVAEGHDGVGQASAQPL
jgi:two-component system sensor histidine kinase SenX3